MPIEIKKNNKKDWHVLEFFVPIMETATVKDEFFIRGMAINETTTRNGITYIAKELEKAAPSFRNKPILEDHENRVRNIVGRTTKNVNFDSMKKGIEFEAKIMDETIKEMINDGRITDVSIGAKVDNLIEDKKENTLTAVGLEGLEISLVAVPGDPGANLANAMQESFDYKKEILMNGEEPVDYFNDEKGGNDKMADEEITQEEPTEEEEVSEEPAEDEEEVAEEKASKKLRRVESELAKYKKAEERAKLKEELKKEIKEEMKINEQVEEPETESDTPAEEEPKKPIEDETKGEVGEESEEEDTTEESLVVEKADTGKGFQIWRDYTKDTNFKRLSR